MTAAVVSLAAALAGCLGLIAWLVYGRLAAADTLQELDDERDDAVVRAERAEYERDAFKTRLADTEQRLAALVQEVSSRENPNSDLDPGDVAARVRRAARDAEARRTDPVRLGTAEAVPADAATGGSEAAGVSRGLDPHERLL